MTRSAKNTSVKALAHDRSLSRNGLDKHLKKGGFGGWGDLSKQHLTRHPEDELDFGLENDAAEVKKVRVPLNEDERADRAWLKMLDLSLTYAANVINTQEKEDALAVRKHCLKTGAVDLAEIARTSLAVSHSPSTSPEAHSVLSSHSFNSRASTSSASASASYK